MRRRINGINFIQHRNIYFKNSALWARFAHLIVLISTSYSFQCNIMNSPLHTIQFIYVWYLRIICIMLHAYTHNMYSRSENRRPSSSAALYRARRYCPFVNSSPSKMYTNVRCIHNNNSIFYPW